MPNIYLVIGAMLSLLAALLHLGCIVFGASWYRFFGAGETLVRLAAAGSVRPTLFATAIAAALTMCALYALSAAGAITARLPLLRLGLCAITCVYLLRGLAGFALAGVAATPAPLGRSAEFWWWSSAICLTFGIVHLVGLRQVWTQL